MGHRLEIGLEEKKSFREQGALLLREAFPRELLSLLERGIAKNIDQPSRDAFHRFEGVGDQGDFTYDYGSHGWIPEYLEFAQVSGIARLAAGLLDVKRVCFFDDSYFIKQAHCAHPAPWHHDFTYYEIDGQIVVAWVPLDPHGKHETLRLASGSHAWGSRHAPFGFDPRGDPKQGIDVSAYDPLPDLESGEYEILEWEVGPGDCIFFDGLTLHGSRGNPTARDLRRFNCRFVGEDARYRKSPIYPFGDGKANADLQDGQRLCEDPSCFPVAWES